MKSPERSCKARAQRKETMAARKKAIRRRDGNNSESGHGPAEKFNGSSGTNSDDELDQRIVGMEKAVGTVFYRNILQEYGRVNQPRLIRDAAVKQKVLLMLESVTRGIDRLEAVLKRIDPNTVQLYSRSCKFRRWARLRTSRHCNTLCSASKNSPGQPNRMLEAIDLLAWHVRRRLDKTPRTAQPRQTAWVSDLLPLCRRSGDLLSGTSGIDGLPTPPPRFRWQVSPPPLSQ